MWRASVGVENTEARQNLNSIESIDSIDKTATRQSTFVIDDGTSPTGILQTETLHRLWRGTAVGDAGKEQQTRRRHVTVKLISVKLNR